MTTLPSTISTSARTVLSATSTHRITHTELIGTPRLVARVGEKHERTRTAMSEDREDGVARHQCRWSTAAMTTAMTTKRALFTGVVLGAGVASVVLVASAALAGTGIGGVFNLG